VGGACGTNGGEENRNGILITKAEVKRPLGRPRCWSLDNIKMDLAEIGRCGVDWIGLTG
jgi:hypothetical protein